LEKPNAFDNQMAFFQAAHFARGAEWQRIYWKENHAPATDDGQVNFRVLVRFDNKPSWDTPPTNIPGGIYEFNVPDDANRLDVNADQIEVMVFIQYMNGAFLNQSWKRAPLLESIGVDYQKPIITLAQQEK
jgi:hypothetical protein